MYCIWQGHNLVIHDEDFLGGWEYFAAAIGKPRAMQLSFRGGT
jgi:hypothetical protein